MKNVRHGLAARAARAGALAATLAAGGACAEEALTGEQVRALLAGNSLQGSFVAEQLTIAFYEDGTLIGTLGLAGSDRGKWTIEGDLYCQHWVRYFGAEERCYRWVAVGDGYEARNADTFRTRDFRGRINKGFPPGLRKVTVDQDPG